MNWIMVALGAVLSLALALRVLELVYQGQSSRSRMELVKAGLPAVAVVTVLLAFYFLNWIPPVPLSLKLGGIYRQVEKVDGAYHLTFEKQAWRQVMKRSDNPFHGDGPAYCFTAVFAPVDLKTTVYHRWQYRMVTPGQSSGKRDFSTTDRIPIRIAGGREGGYRGYTIKQHVPPGEWRVDVETEDGRVIGRVRFRVEAGMEEVSNLHTISY